MKKIAMLHYAYPPNIGGVENLMHEHALVMVNLGYKVKVITGSGEEKNKDIELIVNPKLESIRLFDPDMQDKLLEKGEVDQNFYNLSSEIESELTRDLADCDVVIVHNMITIHRNLAFTYAFKKYAEKNPNKKIIIWVHDHVYINEERIKNNLENIYHTDFLNDLLTRPIENAKYVVVSEVFKNLVLQVMKLSDDQVLVIPAGVDIKSFIGASDVLWSWCKTKSIMDKFPIFFSPTNILERKNLDYEIEVFAEVKNKLPDAVYMISGKTSLHRSTTEYRLELEQKINELGIKDSVYFLSEELKSPLSYDDIKALYRLSDGVLYLSKSENFGIPIIESAIFKTHIFASNLQVFKEIAGNHEIEYIDYTNVTPAQAAERILKNIDQSKLIKLTADMRKKYNLHEVLEKYLIPILNKN